VAILVLFASPGDAGVASRTWCKARSPFSSRRAG